MPDILQKIHCIAVARRKSCGNGYAIIVSYRECHFAVTNHQS